MYDFVTKIKDFNDGDFQITAFSKDGISIGNVLLEKITVFNTLEGFQDKNIFFQIHSVVDPDMMGMGIGTRLYKEAISEAGSRGGLIVSGGFGDTVSTEANYLHSKLKSLGFETIEALELNDIIYPLNSYIPDASDIKIFKYAEI
jgi:GNAT superfamily N-acetyltransferase